MKDLQLIVTQAHSRITELEEEITTARTNMNDLILEIEAVSADDGEAREQSAKILREMEREHELQTGVLEENLQLEDSLAAKEKERSDMQQK